MDFSAKRAPFPSLCMLAVTLLLTAAAHPQAQNNTPPVAGKQGLPGAKGAETSGKAATGSQQGGDSKSASATEHSAWGKGSALSPLAPALPPARVFARPRIGLALGGGGALGLSEIGTLQWLEENHIPVDVIAGTSMGCMISALYSAGRTPEQLKSVMNDRVFASVFSFSNAYTSRSFRRREDSRDLPNGITVGLKHGVSFRNSVLTDQGLNAFLDRQFLRYDDQTDFNTLPIPLRCLSTDLNDARTVTFARGSLPDAIRASVSLPGVYTPFELNGHEYVDGGVLENLPTQTVRNMDADVVLAISLPLTPVGKGDLNSLLGVLGRSFSVAIEGAERQQRKLADVVVMPNLDGFTATDYLKTEELSRRGYAAAEASRAELIKYALPDDQWVAYLRHRAGLRRGPAGPVLRVRVAAPNESATLAVERLFAPLVNQPVDTRQIEALLDQIRADGRYEADYTVGYEPVPQLAQTSNQPQKPGAPGLASETGDPTTSPTGETPVPRSSQPHRDERDPTQISRTAAIESTLGDHPGAPLGAATLPATPQTLADIASRPIILVTVADKKTGPPFLFVGGNVQAQAAGRTRATFETILLNQDLGGYGAELRTHIKLGYLTDLDTEYFRPLTPGQNPNHILFFAPRAGLLRQPFPIYANQVRLASRQFQRLGGGGDFGLTNTRTSEFRAGIDFAQIRWDRQIGDDHQPDYNGQTQRAHVQYSFDTQDRALVPQFGVHIVAEAAFLYDTVGSPNAPQLTVTSSYAHRFGPRTPAAQSSTQAGATAAKPKGANVFVLGVEGGTLFNRNVAEPFRYTLGGPLRLSASAIDEYRGTGYALFEPALLHRIAQLPQPLGQNIYVGGALEFGYIQAPNRPSINREDVFFGLVAETPLGVITAGPAIGSNGERKFNFTLGKLF